MMRLSTRVWFSSLLSACVLFAPALTAGLRLAANEQRQSQSAAPARPWAVWLYLQPDSARSDAPPALGPAALERRRQQGIPIMDDDRPIPARLVAEISRTGARVRVESRLLRAVSVDATSAQLRVLRSLPFIQRIQPVGRLAAAGRPGPFAAKPEVGIGGRAGWFLASASGRRDLNPLGIPVNDSAFYGVNYRALAELGIPLLHEPAIGLTGQGVVVAILDTGFERQHVALQNRLIAAQYDFINGDSIVANQPGEPAGSDPNNQELHGTAVWSLLGGFSTEKIVGPAYNATFLLAKVDAEPGDTEADEDHWVAAAEWAASHGARIICSALYFRSDFTDQPPIPFQQLNGDLTATTVAADRMAGRGILVVQAVGNALPADAGSLAAPADADSVLSVGAVDLNRNLLVFSARGPTHDARPKPEVVAVGTGLAAANSVDQVGLRFGLIGTSYSTAIMAGAAALFMEAHPGLTAERVRLALMEAGHTKNSADNGLGWGLPDVAAAIMFPDGLSTAGITGADLEGNPTSLSAVFNWSAPTRYDRMEPFTFTLVVATDSLFQDTVYSDTVHNAYSHALRAPLRPDSSLWWRVTAESPTGVSRHSNVSGPFTMPHWVRQLNLVGSSSVTDSIRPRLVWEALSAPPPVGPLTYDVEVLSHATSEVLQTMRGLTTTSVQVTLPLTPNRSYRWRVIATAQNGQVDSVTSVYGFVVNSSEAPPATVLFQNFPNPFPNFDLGLTSTRIWFNLAASSIVELTVHDLRGRLVRTLIPASPSCAIQLLPPGLYGRPGSPVAGDPCILTSWDGRDQNGERLPRGIYVLRLLANGKPEYRRMLYQPN